MSTVHLKLGKSAWYTSEPDFSCKLATKLTAWETRWKKARITVSLPVMQSTLRRVSGSLAIICSVLAVTGIGVLFIA